MQTIVLKPIEVRRSGLKMWLLSLAGIPLLVLGVDVLRSRRIIGFFRISSGRTAIPSCSRLATTSGRWS